MDPLDPLHLAGRSRYDAHLPPSQFVDPNYYPHAAHQHQHQHPHPHPQPHHHDASFRPPCPPYQPQYHQPHWHGRGDHHCDDARLRAGAPYLRPPEPPRAPDLLLLPEDRYPSARYHGAVHGEVSVEEPLERLNFDVENRFRMVDDGFNRLRFEEEERRRLVPGYRGNHSYQEDGLDIRSRWPQDANFGEPPAGSIPRHLRYLGGEGNYEGVSTAAAYAPSSRVPPSFFVPDRDREVSYGMGQGMHLPVIRSEIHSNSGSPAVERQFLPPLTLIPPSGHSYPDKNFEVLEKGAKAVNDACGHGSDYITHNKGKRRLSGAGNDYDMVRSPVKPPPKRSSALSRLQFGKSVWNRLEEKPSFLTSPMPFPPPSFPSDNQLEMGELDMPGKSNSVVANASSNFVSTYGTGSGMMKPKKKKKKLIENRENVVIPIVSESLVSGMKDGGTKRLISNTSQQIFNSSEASGKVVASSGKRVNDAGPESCSKKITSIKSADKKTERWIPKSIIVKDDGAGKPDISRRSGITDVTTLEPHAEQKLPTMESSKEHIAVKCDNIAEHDGIKDNNAEYCAQLGVEDGQNHVSAVLESGAGYDASSPKFSGTATETLLKHDAATHLSSDLAFGQNHDTNVLEFRSEDSSSQPFSQAQSEALLEGGTARLSSDLVSTDNTIVQCCNQKEKYKRDDDKQLESPEEKEKYGGDNQEESGCPDNDLVPSSYTYLPASATVSDVQCPNTGFSSSDLYDNSTAINNLKWNPQTNQEQDSEVVMMAKELISTDGGQAETTDYSLRISVQSVSDHLPSNKDSILDQNLQDITLIEKDDKLSTHVQVELPQPGCFGTGKKSAISSILVSPTLPGTDSLLISEVQNVTNQETYFPNKDESSTFTDKDDIANQKNGHTILDSLIDSVVLLSSEADGPKSGKTAFPCEAKFENTGNLELSETKEVSAVSKSTREGLTQKTPLSSSVSELLPSSTNSVKLLKETVRLSGITRNRTWHRKDVPSTSVQCPRGGPMSKISPKKLGKFQSSYVRKGNALIRNPAIELSHRRSVHGLDVSNNTRKQLTSRSLKFERKVNADHNHISSNPTFERPKTPPLPIGNKLLSCTSGPTVSVSNPIPDDTMPDAANTTHAKQLGMVTSSGDDQNIIMSKLSGQSNSQKITYVKHKSNQLIAASGSMSGTQADHHVERSRLVSLSMPSDLYCRKTKNQLVRNVCSSDNLQDSVTVSNTNLDDQRVSTVSSSNMTTGLLRERLGKVLRKVRKHARFSHVWTLNQEQSNKTGYTLLDCRKVLPYFVPWKRTVTWANTSPGLKRSPLSLICQKPWSAKKKTAMYKLSNHGFSMRKSGAAGTSMPSLKWSRSMEKRSKIANEEATLLVEEAQRKKREKRKSLSLSAKRQNCELRERVFRVGSERYRMDPSRHTLVRLQDKNSSCSTDKEVTDDVESSLVPRRLSIGSDQYIRVGNGNKLVRDPKKLVRMLASEKVRWSLHTARSRMAKKQHYCQFFTRFGQCNRKDGGCPFIHDSAKIAICTKFLRGSCSNANCRLTHKVIPERMPDCSYFLQGLCTKTSCPYRHVNVNPSASVCEAFLKGYCADGDECRKKHSYVCPVFKATGKCSQRSECKLHHPKGENKPGKRKRSMLQNNTWGRYFGSNISEVGETLAVTSDENEANAEDIFWSDGRFTDFIGLNPGNDSNIMASTVPTVALQTHPNTEIAEMMQSDDLDALIKPIRVMGKACSILPPINTFI